MNRKKKKALLITGLAAGLVFQFIGITSGADHLRIVGGVCIGIGAGLFSLSVNRLYRISYEKEFPQNVRREQIERADERNIQIRRRAKSRSSDISRWAVLGLAWVNYFLMGGPLWITFALVGIFVLVYILEWYYTDKYEKEM